MPKNKQKIVEPINSSAKPLCDMTIEESSKLSPEEIAKLPKPDLSYESYQDKLEKDQFNEKNFGGTEITQKSLDAIPSKSYIPSRPSDISTLPFWTDKELSKTQTEIFPEIEDKTLNPLQMLLQLKRHPTEQEALEAKKYSDSLPKDEKIVYAVSGRHPDHSTEMVLINIMTVPHEAENATDDNIRAHILEKETCYHNADSIMKPTVLKFDALLDAGWIFEASILARTVDSQIAHELVVDLIAEHKKLPCIDLENLTRTVFDDWGPSLNDLESFEPNTK